MDLVNTIKTLLLGSGVLTIVAPFLINLVLKLFGCSGDDVMTKDVVEVAMCTGGDLFAIPVSLQLFIGGVMAGGIAILTGFFKTGTFKQNFFNRSVPMINPATEEVKPGVVTPNQVASH